MVHLWAIAFTLTATPMWLRSASGWTFDPFGGEIADGNIYGRGACDMKGGLASSIIAAEAFTEEYPRL